MASNAKALSFLSGDLSLSGTEVSINVAGSVQSDSITGSTITMKNTGSTIVASDGSTAVLSESGGTVTIDADVSTIGSATISGGSITGTEIDLKSSGTTIFASDGTTAVLSESGGVVTLTADAAVIEGSSSGNLVRITQTGSGNALVVEDSSNPDSTPFVVSPDGKVFIGSNTSITSFFGSSPSKLAVSGVASPLVIESVGINEYGSRIDLLKTRGTTSNSKTIINNNDTLGEIYFGGTDGTSAIPAARISAGVDGNPGTNDMPGRLVFSTTADGASIPTERMRIDSSGKLWLADDFAEPSNSSDRGDITITNGTGPADLLFLDRGLSAARMGVDTNDSGNFKFVTDREFVFRTGGTSYSAFSTGSDSMRIDSSGNVGIGTTTSAVSKLEVAGGQIIAARISGEPIGNDSGGFAFNRSGNRYGGMFLNTVDDLFVWNHLSNDLIFGTSSTERMRIDSSGNVNISNLLASSDVQTDASKNLTTSSDARLKNDLGVITDSAINVVQQIIPKYFSWKNDENKTQQLGFFAQDIHPVLPEAAPRALKYIEVGKDENDEPILEQVLDEEGNPDYEWGFTDRPIIAMCVKAIQEQQTIIESQQSQIDTLTSKTQEQDFTIASLISRIEALENA